MRDFSLSRFNPDFAEIISGGVDDLKLKGEFPSNLLATIICGIDEDESFSKTDCTTSSCDWA